MLSWSKGPKVGSVRQTQVTIAVFTALALASLLLPFPGSAGDDGGDRPSGPNPLTALAAVSAQAAPSETKSDGAVGCRWTGDRLVFNGPRAEKKIALTFDDGPDTRFTPLYLDALKKRDVRATFFMVGQRIPGNEALLKRMLAEGHDLGNHSYNHADLRGDRKDTAFQLPYTDLLIERATGFKPCLFRAPYGALNASVLHLAEKEGLLTVGWDNDPKDTQRPGAEVVLQRVLEQARPGGIILLHDGAGQQQANLDALPSIISRLRKQGYELVPASELLGVEPARSASERGPYGEVNSIDEASAAAKALAPDPGESGETGYGAAPTP